MNQYNTPVKYGLIAGAMMIAIILLLYIISATSLGTMLPMLVYIPVLFLMIWGGITYRKEIGGYKNFAQAFVAVFIISVTATMLFDSFGYLLYKVIDPELPELIKQKTLDNTTEWMEKMGAPDDKIEETIKEVADRDFSPTIASQGIRYVSSIVIGAILSALIALFVSRPENKPEVKPEQ